MRYVIITDVVPSLTYTMSANRDSIKEVVKMLGQMNALDHIITVAAEQGIKDIKLLLEAKP